jgi:hypothetical protein
MEVSGQLHAPAALPPVMSNMYKETAPFWLTKIITITLIQFF